MTDKQRNYIITAGSLIAVLTSLAIGIAILKTGADTNSLFVRTSELVGKCWLILLILLVIPLATSYLMYVVISMLREKSLGKLGAHALAVHSGFLLVGMTVAVLTTFAFMEFMGDAIPKLSADTPVAGIDAGDGSMVYSHWVDRSIATANTAQKVIGRAVFLVILASILFAFVTGRYFPRFADGVSAYSKRMSEISMKWLQAILLTMPVAVFCLVLPMAARAGFSAIGMAGIFILFISGLLIVSLGLLYLAVHIWGVHSVADFARAMVPSQIVAASTRSSLATMPSLIETAELRLGVPREVAAVIIPFFISVFRSNRVVSSNAKFIYLSYVYELDIEVSTFAIFLLVQIVMSFGSPGIPSGGKYINLPIYVAAGIPMDGYILLRSVDAIPDILKTILNTTEVMAVTSVAARKTEWASSALSRPGTSAVP